MNRGEGVALWPRFYYGWAIVGISAVVWTIAAGLFNVGGVFLKPIAAEFGWSRGTISGAISLSAILAGVLAIVTGVLTDRYGPRAVVLGGGLLAAIGLSLLSWMGTLWQLFLFWALIGIGMAALNTPTAAAVSRWFTGHKKGLALGLATSGAGAGQVFIPPLATFLIARTDWRMAFLLLGLLVGAVLGILSLGLRKRPEDIGLKPYGGGEEAGIATATEQGFSLFQALRTQALWRIILASALATSAFATITVHFIPYATDVGISPMAAASLISIRGVIGIMSRAPWGAASDRLGNKQTLALCFGLGGLPFLFLPFTSSFGLLLFLTAFFGFAQAAFAVGRYGLLGELFGMASIGAIMGVSEAGTLLGLGLGAVLAGYIFDLTRSYFWAFLTSGLRLFVAALLIFTLKPSPRGNE